MFEAPATAPMEFRDYFGILRRRAWVIILVTAIVVGAAAAWSFSRPNEYEASGTLVVPTSGSNSGDVGNQADIIQSQAVHALAEQASPGVDGVTASAGTTGGSITVTSTNRNPAQAARTVNAHVDAYLAYLRQQAQHQFDVLNQTLQPQIASLQQQIAALDQQIALAAAGVGPPNPVAATQRSALSAQLAPLQTQLQNSSIGAALAGQDVQVVSRATPPTQRTSPDPKTDLLVALGAGLLLGVAVAFLLEFLDDSIRGRQDLLAAAGNSVPVMGVIPAGRSSRADVVSISAPQSPAAEAYRSLRTAVNFAQLKGSNCIEITSTRSRQGKTETLANLAVLAARAGQRVVVVDCDLRFPRVHDYFGLSNQVGFTSVVHGELLSSALAAGARRRAALRAPVGSHPAQPVRAAGQRALPRSPRLVAGRRHPGDRRHAPCAHRHRRRRAGAVGRGHPHRRRRPGHPPEAGAPGARGLPSDLGPDPRPRALQRRQRRDRGLREGAGRRERRQARRRRTVEPPRAECQRRLGDPTARSAGPATPRSLPRPPRPTGRASAHARPGRGGGCPDRRARPGGRRRPR